MRRDGQVFGTRKRVMVYEYVFDEPQTQALREARELSEKTGLELEVTDLSRESAPRRILRSAMSIFDGLRGSRLSAESLFGASENSEGIRPQACGP